ncbi:Stk1 family PASTA domain-containing Ser/Thr kinase [Mobilicoccus massiliensis]|uniref:Stk1 family PASTA domain-containing Ser/Thr kinase n=1 Tax=Mobilicoccus massiliensis TaxID=1522310 RepID=UPI001FE451A9|nr:Stk1 family PASTA domain-containing Ser/Thr kinase [Mobilicoccus massiliensis]
MVNDERRLLAGRYEVGELIGRGGMADVHLGYDTRLGREVAVKILRSELARDRSFLMRFRREAQSAASLNHPNIVAVFDSGEDTIRENSGATVSVPFIVMEYVRGRTLRDILTDDGPMDPFEAARAMAQVLRALDYSHDNGIVHRDIKPANVMMGPNGQPKVMDFGIARAIADTAATMTNTSVVVGTAQYLSPEQAQGQEVDARSDLYSAGCLLYELLTGRPPFIGDSPVAIAYQHVGEPPQPPSVFSTGIPNALDVVALHSLAKDPAQRYQTGAAFADDLDAVITGGPTLAAREAVANGQLAAPERSWEGGATGSTAAVPAGSVAVVDETYETESRKRPIWAYVAGALALLAILLGVLWGLGVFKRDPEPVVVPTVVQKTQQEATTILQRAGFQVQAQQVRNRAKAGIVVDQEPKAQSTQPYGSAVTLSVSSGPGMVTIPDLANYEQTSAIDKLKSLGLTEGTIEPVDSMTVDQGKVVKTEPAAGKRVAEGSTVNLKISSGRSTVPDLIGMSLRQATEALGKVGLKADPVEVESDRREGTVISQAYAKGTKVNMGEAVQISIAKPRPEPSVSVTTVTQTPTPSQPSTNPSPSDSPPRTPTTAPNPADTAPADENTGSPQN